MQASAGSITPDKTATVEGTRPTGGQERKNIRPGLRVEIILKQDQRSGRRTIGIVKDILTSSAFHSRGIKVRLESGQIGRVQTVLPEDKP